MQWPSRHSLLDTQLSDDGLGIDHEAAGGWPNFFELVGHVMPSAIETGPPHRWNQIDQENAPKKMYNVLSQVHNDLDVEDVKLTGSTPRSIPARDR